MNREKSIRRAHPSRKGYKKSLRKLQIELVKFQRHLIKYDHKILLLFEGRDAAGKDGVIKRITQHLSPRETRIVALGKPSSRDQAAWYFQRYVAHLPVSQELVLFNRSWYNRAGVEIVMEFCTDAEYELFLEQVVPFEQLLVASGVQLFKYYLDISKDEQKRRLEARGRDPLTQWKSSPIDEVALSHWDDYSNARNRMLSTTHSEAAPWTIVQADDKRRARLNIIRHLLSRVDCLDKDEHVATPDPEMVYEYQKSHIHRLSP